MFQTIDEIKQYINVSKYLDINILKPYIETAITEKITPLVGSSILEKLENSSFSMDNKAFIFSQIQKAVANYAVAYSIPFLKMHLSSAGANTYNDNKTERSPWWDIRDYGLNAINIADKALNVAVLSLQNSILVLELPFINDLQKSLFRTPSEFSDIYPIGNSYEIFLKLIPLMDDIWALSLQNFLSECTLSDIKKETTALALLKKYIAYSTLADAVLSQAFTFTISGIVIQWEQLPWQKNQIINQSQLLELRVNFVQKAGSYKTLLLDFLKNNPEKFPCFASKKQDVREPVLKKSGIYF